MPQITAQRKYLLGAAGLVVLVGIIIIAWPFLRSSDARSPVPESIEIQNNDAFDLSATPRDTEPARPQRPGASATPLTEYVIVYISGAVLHPDVYQLPPDARVKDVVLVAGGLTEDAAVDRINLADHVADAQHIHIPRQDEAAPASQIERVDATESSADAPLNINTASAADLDSLSGIGPAIAQRIVEYRTVNGPFQSVEDLQQVKGIGPALFAKIAPLITVGP
ncbi:MAG: helix-hairpin-helix domain-containing protein [Roseiflexaceae bacterium]